VAFNDGSRRWRDDFPQLFAAWLATQSAAHHATVQVRNSTPVPSAFTTALLAGGLAVLLAVVVMFVDPSQPASLGTTEAVAAEKSSGRFALFGAPPPQAQPLDMDLAVERLSVNILGWDERPYQLWTSTSPEISPALASVVPDDWVAAGSRPDIALAALEPYYRRAEIREFHQFTAATAADEVPLLFSGAEYQRIVGVTIERTDAALNERGLLVYTLNVRNLDNNPVEHVRVIESMPFDQAEQVVDTNPPAYMSSEGALIWQIADLQPQESRSLTVMLDGSEITAPLQTVAALDVETQFSVKTEVLAAAYPEPAPVEESIVPEVALPEGQPEPAIVPFEEPVAPLLADDSTAPAGWNAYDPTVPLENEAPIEPLVSQEPENIEPTEPFVPDAEPIVPEFAPIEPLDREPLRPSVVEESVVPEEPPTPQPRPIPIDPTRPPRPLLSLTARTDKAVRAGEVVTTVYEIKNEGEAPAQDVTLTVHIPPELQHKYGKEVEHRIRQLRPGESHQARLLTRASAEGTAQLDAVLLLEGAPEDQSKLSVKVLGARPQPSARPR